MAKKWADKPDSNFREGISAELGVCSRPVWVSAYCGNLPKNHHGSGGFFGGSLQWIVLVVVSTKYWKIKRGGKNNSMLFLSWFPVFPYFPSFVSTNATWPR